MPLDIKIEDTRTPIWAWMIVLLPLLILLFISVAVYVTGHNHAKFLSESLVPIDAAVISVKEEQCGGRARHACYRIELLGSLDGIDHKYQTYDVSNGRFSYAEDKNGSLSVIQGQRVQKILVDPHPVNVGISKMYWSRNGPVEDFKINSAILLVFISFEIFIVPVGFWLGTRKENSATSIIHLPTNG